MSGHNKWSQIKHKKEAKDQKRSKLFSQLVKEISIAARGNQGPNFNPHLRAAVERAKDAKVPKENIERALKKASDSKNLEEITIEAYGPGGIAIIAEALTDNKNRTVNEIKHLLSEHDGKFAESGSVGWAFEKEDGEWKPKFPQEISNEDKQKLQKLLEALENHDDVSSVSHNAKT
ncbi:MAG: YebC/PmpR family DNA-binding transcriptional regulator [bacterium]|nr:YebC/PmpR family DNA-binding transcriptional regulator [bacterium]